ncbi:hypothetical protein ElyMa_001150600, partial [Elysia marginata]
GTVLFLVVVIVIIAVILFYRKRKGLSFCCGSTKTCSDLEKNMRHNQAVMAEPHQRNKIMLGNCSTNSSGMITSPGDKVMNNNTSNNGRVPRFSRTNGDVPHETLPLQRVNFQEEQVSLGVGLWGHQDHPGSQQRVRQASFPGEDHNLQPQHQQQQQQNNEQMFPPSGMFPPSPSRNQPPASVSPRPGILRNGGPTWKHGQVQAMDSIGREKLQVQMLGREANMEAGGENDPLLVSEGQNQAGARRAASPHHVQGHYQTAPGNSTISHSPPLVQGGINQRPYLHHHFTNSNSSVPEVTFAPQTPYGHPPKVVATFTRSSSVIATPEGEVDEDDMEAIVPRFSQLLPDMDGGDTASAGGASPDQEEAAQDPRRTEESSGTTQQLRSPNQRLLPRANPAPGRLNQPAQPRATPAPPAARQAGGNQPDHHIMNLKEQQLQESLTSGPSSSLDSQLKYPSDLSQTEALKTMTPDEAEPSTQETTLKTQHSPIEAKDPSNAAVPNANRKMSKTGEPTRFSEETERKKQAGEGVGGSGSGVANTTSNSLERKRNQAARDRRRMASGGSTTSNSSRSSTLDRHRNLSSSEQPAKVAAEKTVDNSSTPVTTTVKVPHTSHPVPFDGDGEESQLKETHGLDTPEDIEQTQQKQVSPEGQLSASSSIHSADGSPTRANAYQRSQSENISSGSESPHRPPPRSNSEEKAQSSNRPVAKVRPMPTSDSPVPGKSSEGLRPVPGSANILSYSSEEDTEDEEADRGSEASCEDEAGTDGNHDEDSSQRQQDQAEDRHQ